VYCYYDSSPTVNNCTISSNSANGAEGYGGGICCIGSSPTVSNCSISGNSASEGGGISCDSSSNPIVANCTLNGNVANVGGGISSKNLSVPVITNNIIANSRFGSGIHAIYSNPIISYNDVWGNIDGDYDGWAWPGEGDISADPCFVAPGYWEDPSSTPSDPNDDVWTDGDYHLLAGSSCIDAGDNAAVPADIADLDGDGNTVEPTPWDFDGHPRFVDDPGTIDTGIGTPPIVDIGADEFPYLGDLDFSGFVNFVDYALFANHWPRTSCGTCGGADLTGDSDVGPDDVRVFCENWLLGAQ
jgi:hypothetical protein